MVPRAGREKEVGMNEGSLARAKIGRKMGVCCFRCKKKGSGEGERGTAGEQNSS